MGLWIIAAIVLAMIAMIVVSVRRGLQMKELAHNGVVVQGNVVEKQRRKTAAGHQTAAFLKYQFDTAQGFSHSNRIAVTEEMYSEYQEGDSIDIVYLEDKPGVNAARYMVNLSRKALKLPPI